jgi:hypothetical protein
MKRQPFKIRAFTPKEAGQLQTSLDTLYKYKAESYKYTKNGSATSVPYQEIEHHRHSVSGTGSPTMAISLSFNTKYRDVMSIQIQPIGTAYNVNIVDFTASSMNIQISATANITSTVNFFVQIVGSLE